ncbi:MAG: porin [Phycisphaerae bacterium]
MDLCNWTKRAVILAALGTLVNGVYAADSTSTDVQTELQTLKARIAQLEKKENENWLTEERTAQIKSIVNEAIADAKTRGQFADGDLQAGYKNGFFIQTADGKTKLNINGYIQVRYEFAHNNYRNGNVVPAGASGASDPGNTNGFEVRRARLSFAGNLFDPAVFFKVEGDFGGASTNSGNFQLTDAYIGYAFCDFFKIKAGSFKVPFTKVEFMVSDYNLGLMERPDENYPFDAQRTLGVDFFGDIVKDQLVYDVSINDGSNSNLGGRVNDTAGALDNRLGFYARTSWAGSGKVSDFADESDLRKDNSEFVWLLGGAVGYESQNSTSGAFPAAQSSASINGLSTADSPGFLGASTLNGDLYRATLDWSAKYQGWSFNTAGYYQQINQNEAGAGSTVSPYGTSASKGNDAAFGDYGYYGQVGYMVIPQKLELVGRAGQVITEGYPNRGEYYTLGANYYIFGQNVKVQGELTYIPNESAYTYSSADVIKNTQEMIARVQFQVRF